MFNQVISSKQVLQISFKIFNASEVILSKMAHNQLIISKQCRQILITNNSKINSWIILTWWIKINNNNNSSWDKAHKWKNSIVKYNQWITIWVVVWWTNNSCSKINKCNNNNGKINCHNNSIQCKTIKDSIQLLTNHKLLKIFKIKHFWIWQTMVFHIESEMCEEGDDECGCMKKTAHLGR